MVFFLACTGRDEEDFRRFENKVDEVHHLLKGMNNNDRKLSTPAFDITKQ